MAYPYGQVQAWNSVSAQGLDWNKYLNEVTSHYDIEADLNRYRNSQKDDSKDSWIDKGDEDDLREGSDADSTHGSNYGGSDASVRSQDSYGNKDLDNDSMISEGSHYDDYSIRSGNDHSPDISQSRDWYNTDRQDSRSITPKSNRSNSRNKNREVKRTDREDRGQRSRHSKHYERSGWNTDGRSNRGKDRRSESYRAGADRCSRSPIHGKEHKVGRSESYRAGADRCSRSPIHGKEHKRERIERFSMSPARDRETRNYRYRDQDKERSYTHTFNRSPQEHREQSYERGTQEKGSSPSPLKYYNEESEDRYRGSHKNQRRSNNKKTPSVSSRQNARSPVNRDKRKQSRSLEKDTYHRKQINRDQRKRSRSLEKDTYHRKQFKRNETHHGHDDISGQDSETSVQHWPGMNSEKAMELRLQTGMTGPSSLTLFPTNVAIEEQPNVFGQFFQYQTGNTQHIPGGIQHAAVEPSSQSHNFVPPNLTNQSVAGQTWVFGNSGQLPPSQVRPLTQNININQQPSGPKCQAPTMGFHNVGQQPVTGNIGRQSFVFGPTSTSQVQAFTPSNFGGHSNSVRNSNSVTHTSFVKTEIHRVKTTTCVMTGPGTIQTQYVNNTQKGLPLKVNSSQVDSSLENVHRKSSAVTGNTISNVSVIVGKPVKYNTTSQKSDRQPQTDSKVQPPGKLDKQPQTDSKDKPPGKLDKQPQTDSKDKPPGKLDKQPQTDSKVQPPGKLDKQPQTDSKVQPPGKLDKQPQTDSKDKPPGKLDKQPQKDSKVQPPGKLDKQPQTDSKVQPPGKLDKQPQTDSKVQPPGKLDKQPQTDSKVQPPGKLDKQPQTDSKVQPPGKLDKQPQTDSKVQPPGKLDKQPQTDSKVQPPGKLDKQPQTDSKVQPPGKLDKQPQTDSKVQPPGKLDKQPQTDSKVQPPGKLDKQPQTDSKVQPPGKLDKQPQTDSKVQPPGKLDKQPQTDSKVQPPGKLDKQPQKDSKVQPPGKLDKQPQTDSKVQPPGKLDKQPQKDSKVQPPGKLDKQPQTDSKVQPPGKLDKQPQTDSKVQPPGKLDKQPQKDSKVQPPGKLDKQPQTDSKVQPPGKLDKPRRKLDKPPHTDCKDEPAKKLGKPSEAGFKDKPSQNLDKPSQAGLKDPPSQNLDKPPQTDFKNKPSQESDKPPHTDSKIKSPRKSDIPPQTDFKDKPTRKSENPLQTDSKDKSSQNLDKPPHAYLKNKPSQKSDKPSHNDSKDKSPRKLDNPLQTDSKDKPSQKLDKSHQADFKNKSLQKLDKPSHTDFKDEQLQKLDNPTQTDSKEKLSQKLDKPPQTDSKDKSSQKFDKPQHTDSKDMSSKKLDKPLQTDSKDKSPQKLDKSPQTSSKDTSSKTLDKSLQTGSKDMPLHKLYKPPQTNLKDKPSQKLDNPPQTHSKGKPLQKLDKSPQTNFKDKPLQKLDKPPQTDSKDKCSQKLDKPPQTDSKDKSSQKLDKSPQTNFKDKPSQKFDKPHDTNFKDKPLVLFNTQGVLVSSDSLQLGGENDRLSFDSHGRLIATDAKVLSDNYSQGVGKPTMKWQNKINSVVHEVPRLRGKTPTRCPLPECNYVDHRFKRHAYSKHIPYIFRENSWFKHSKCCVEAIQQLAIWILGDGGTIDQLVTLINESELMPMQCFIRPCDYVHMTKLCKDHGWPSPVTFTLRPINSPACFIHWRALILLLLFVSKERRTRFKEMFSTSTDEYKSLQGQTISVISVSQTNSSKNSANSPKSENDRVEIWKDINLKKHNELSSIFSLDGLKDNSSSISTWHEIRKNEYRPVAKDLDKVVYNELDSEVSVKEISYGRQPYIVGQRSESNKPRDSKAELVRSQHFGLYKQVELKQDHSERSLGQRSESNKLRDSKLELIRSQHLGLNKPAELKKDQLKFQMAELEKSKYQSERSLGQRSESSITRDTTSNKSVLYKSKDQPERSLGQRSESSITRDTTYNISVLYKSEDLRSHSESNLKLCERNDHMSVTESVDRISSNLSWTESFYGNKSERSNVMSDEKQSDLYTSKVFELGNISNNIQLPATETRNEQSLYKKEEQNKTKVFEYGHVSSRGQHEQFELSKGQHEQFELSKGQHEQFELKTGMQDKQHYEWDGVLAESKVDRDRVLAESKILCPTVFEYSHSSTKMPTVEDPNKESTIIRQNRIMCESGNAGNDNSQRPICTLLNRKSTLQWSPEPNSFDVSENITVENSFDNSFKDTEPTFRGSSNTYRTEATEESCTVENIDLQSALSAWSKELSLDLEESKKSLKQILYRKTSSENVDGGHDKYHTPRRTRSSQRLTYDSRQLYDEGLSDMSEDGSFIEISSEEENTYTEKDKPIKGPSKSTSAVGYHGDHMKGPSNSTAAVGYYGEPIKAPSKSGSAEGYYREPMKAPTKSTSAEGYYGEPMKASSKSTSAEGYYGGPKKGPSKSTSDGYHGELIVNTGKPVHSKDYSHQSTAHLIKQSNKVAAEGSKTSLSRQDQLKHPIGEPLKKSIDNSLDELWRSTKHKDSENKSISTLTTSNTIQGQRQQKSLNDMWEAVKNASDTDKKYRWVGDLLFYKDKNTKDEWTLYSGKEIPKPAQKTLSSTGGGAYQQGYGAPGYPAQGYGAQPGYGPQGGFGGAPPGIDPQVYQWFITVDLDKSGHITAHELQQALVNGNWSHFNPETCRLMISMFDRDNTGTIQLHEFQALWNYIQQWKGVFERFDSNRSGSIEAPELVAAYQQMGYNMSPQFGHIVIAKFDVHGRRSLTLDNFIQSCVMLKSLTDSFKQRDPQMIGSIRMSYEDFMTTAVFNKI